MEHEVTRYRTSNFVDGTSDVCVRRRINDNDAEAIAARMAREGKYEKAWAFLLAYFEDKEKSGR